MQSNPCALLPRWWWNCVSAPSPSAPPCLRSPHRCGRAQQPARCGRGRPLSLRAQQGPALAAFVGLADAGAATGWPPRAERGLKQRRRARRWTSRRCGRLLAVPEGRLSPARRPVWPRRLVRCDSHSRCRVSVTCGHAWQEWMKATPSRRPDIFPEFKPLKPQLPQPMPGDPEVPNDEEEADEKRQKVRQRAGCGARAQAVIQRPVTRSGLVAFCPVRAAHTAATRDFFAAWGAARQEGPRQGEPGRPGTARKRKAREARGARGAVDLPEALWGAGVCRHVLMQRLRWLVTPFLSVEQLQPVCSVASPGPALVRPCGFLWPLRARPAHNSAGRDVSAGCRACGLHESNVRTTCALSAFNSAVFSSSCFCNAVTAVWRKSERQDQRE